LRLTHIPLNFYVCMTKTGEEGGERELLL